MYLLTRIPNSHMRLTCELQFHRKMHFCNFKRTFGIQLQSACTSSMHWHNYLVRCVYEVYCTDPDAKYTYTWKTHHKITRTWNWAWRSQEKEIQMWSKNSNWRKSIPLEDWRFNRFGWFDFAQPIENDRWMETLQSKNRSLANDLRHTCAE